MNPFRKVWEWFVGVVRFFSRGSLWLALTGVVVLAGCASFDTVYIATSPQADAMRTCAALTDALTPGVSPLAAATLARNAVGTGAALGDNPAASMRTCADMYDTLTD